MNPLSAPAAMLSMRLVKPEPDKTTFASALVERLVTLMTGPREQPVKVTIVVSKIRWELCMACECGLSSKLSHTGPRRSNRDSGTDHAIPCGLERFVSLRHRVFAGSWFEPIQTVRTEIKTGGFDSRMKLSRASQSFWLATLPVTGI